MKRTHQTMTPHYTNRAFAMSSRIGGWDGPATRAAQQDILDRCYICGMTAAQAAYVLAVEYRLHSALDASREEAAHFADELRALGVTAKCVA